MVGYSIGECGNSLVMNSLFGFAMMYYTDALGLAHAQAGLAMAVAVFWDAITDPLMGHISDNTRSRFGRRHLYLFLGGIATIITYVFLWHVPAAFTADTQLLFWYLVAINLLQRTAVTVFYVPYVALGFEICTDYRERVTLQGIRSAINMLSNLLGPGLAWAIFFANNESVRATSVPGNYVSMGLAFSAVSLIAFVLVVIVTRSHIKDTRNATTEGNTLFAFITDMREIVTDRLARYVLLFTIVVWTGIAFGSSLQMYLYEHFMRFTGIEKTIVHGGSMAAFGLGSLAAPWLTTRFEKRGGVVWGALQTIAANAVLTVLFLPGILIPGQHATVLSFDIPIAFICFAAFHMTYWMGNGIIFPTILSMVADVAEINEIRTGTNKDGAYAAVFSFSQKVAISLAVLGSGYILQFIGFVQGTEMIQSASTLWKLCAWTLLAGPAIAVVSLWLIRGYPVTGTMLTEIRANKAGRQEPGT